MEEVSGAAVVIKSRGLREAPAQEANSRDK